MLNKLFKTQPQGQTITLNIDGMHCTGCAMNIDGALEETEGIFKANTNFAKSQVEISFDPQKIDQEKISQVIQAQGYQVNS